MLVNTEKWSVDVRRELYGLVFVVNDRHICLPETYTELLLTLDRDYFELFIHENIGRLIEFTDKNYDNENTHLLSPENILIDNEKVDIFLIVLFRNFFDSL